MSNAVYPHSEIHNGRPELLEACKFAYWLMGIEFPRDEDEDKSCDLLKRAIVKAESYAPTPPEIDTDQSGWISVNDEQKPLEKQDVQVVCFDNGEYFVAPAQYSTREPGDPRGETFWSGWDKLLDPLFWKPLDKFPPHLIQTPTETEPIASTSQQ